MISKLWPYTVLLLLGIYLLKLITAGDFTIYSNPRYYWFAATAAAVLVLVGTLGLAVTLVKTSKPKFESGTIKDLKLVALLLAGLATLFTVYGFLLLILVLLVPMKNGHVDKVLRQSIWLNGLVIIALGIAFLLPATRLSPLTAHQRYSDLNTLTGDTSLKSAAEKFQVDETKYTISDWIKSMNVNLDVNYFKDKQVSVDGFLFLPEEFPLNMFMVARFRVSCCAIDATPVGIPVNYDWAEAGLASNNWVRVTGRFTTREIEGVERIVIEPDIVEITATPRDPYIF